MEVGTCYALRDQCLGDLNNLWSIIRRLYFEYFPTVAFTEFDPEKSASEKRSWMLQKLAKEGWTPLPSADDEGLTPELQNLFFILRDEADPHTKFQKMFVMLPFTEFPEGQRRYSLPTENNIPAVVRYICINFDDASTDMDIKEFDKAVENATWDGWKIYKENLVTPDDEVEMAKYVHCWKAGSSEASTDSEKKRPCTFGDVPRRPRSSRS